MKEIKVKYFGDQIKKLEVTKKGDWVDLRAAEKVELKAGEFYKIPLGVAMELPEGYEAHVVPRSSTFEKYGIIQTNGIAIIDNSYRGDHDQWMMPVYAVRDTTINQYDRICQFRIVKNQPKVGFVTVNYLEGKDRGGFGSTGVN